jgi:hypothetical protein
LTLRKSNYSKKLGLRSAFRLHDTISSLITTTTATTATATTTATVTSSSTITTAPALKLISKSSVSGKTLE